MARMKNIAGLKSGRLTAGTWFRKGGSIWWRCSCDCGGSVNLKTSRLLGKHKTLSCGCLWRETVPGANRTHQRTGSYLHRIWGLLIQRCCNPNNPAFHKYGGRGITVCERWRNSFEAFATDVGERPSPKHSIDRKDNDGPYSPENCRWATRTTQARNRKTNCLITVSGITKTLQEWANETGIERRTISARIRRGWTPERAVSEPVSA